ncbi:unnamed protein product [Malus baccata var. baccata]
MEMHSVDSSAEDTAIEDKLLDSVLAILISKDEAVSARAFLEANKGNESCARLLKMWNCLKPSSQKVLSLVAEVKTLEKDKEHLRINLRTAEEELRSADYFQPPLIFLMSSCLAFPGRKYIVE